MKDTPFTILTVRSTNWIEANIIALESLARTDSGLKSKKSCRLEYLRRMASTKSNQRKLSLLTASYIVLPDAYMT